MIDLPGEYNVHNVFNVSDLYPCILGEPLYLRTNPLQEGENDASMEGTRPFTRSQARELQGLQMMIMQKGTWEKPEDCQWRIYNVWKN